MKQWKSNEPINLLQRAQTLIKYQKRTKSTQGTNIIFNQNKDKLTNLKHAPMQPTNISLKFAKIS